MRRLYWLALRAVENLVFNRNIFGRAPRASAETYRNIFKDASSRSFSEIDEFEEKLGYRIDSRWLNDLALHTQVVIKKSRVNWQHGRVLYASLRHYLASAGGPTLPLVVFETGTARGFSSVTMARALLDSATEGVVITVDSLPHNRRMYWNCIADVQGRRSRQELLASWSEELSRIFFVQAFTPQQLGRFGLSHIGFAFLDAQHTFEAVMDEFLFVSERQLMGDVIVFDDVTPTSFPGVVQAVTKIQESGLYSMEYVGNPEERGYVIATRLLD